MLINIIPADKAISLVKEVEKNLNNHLKNIEEYLGKEKFELLIHLIKFKNIK